VVNKCSHTARHRLAAEIDRMNLFKIAAFNAKRPTDARASEIKCQIIVICKLAGVFGLPFRCR